MCMILEVLGLIPMQIITPTHCRSARKAVDYRKKGRTSGVIVQPRIQGAHGDRFWLNLHDVVAQSESPNLGYFNIVTQSAKWRYDDDLFTVTCKLFATRARGKGVVQGESSCNLGSNVQTETDLGLIYTMPKLRVNLLPWVTSTSTRKVQKEDTMTIYLQVLANYLLHERRDRDQCQ